MIKKATAAFIGVALIIPAFTHAQEVEEAPSLVPVFAESCLMPGVDHNDRSEQITGDGRWTLQDSVSVNIAGLGISRSMRSKPRFEDFVDATEWSGTIDGMDAKAVLISFEEDARFQHACVIVVEGLRNAMPFSDQLKDAFEGFGIKRKSVDLVHYYEFAGTLKPDEHPVDDRHRIHGEIFTRSQAGTIRNTAHIYVAY